MSSEVETDTTATLRETLLEKALDVFVRYGYRKTSMEDVATAVGISRQTVYLHFRSKEALFRAGTEYLFDRALAAVGAALEGDTPLEDALLSAFDEWHGRFIETFLQSPHIGEIMEASNSLASDSVAAKEQEFVNLLAAAMEAAQLQLEAVQMSAVEAASLLNATSRGYKHAVSSRAEYKQNMQAAIRVLCAAGGARKGRKRKRSSASKS